MESKSIKKIAKKQKQTLMNVPDVIRHILCKFLTDKDLTNLIVAFGFKNQESQFYYNRIRDVVQHNSRIVQRFTGTKTIDVRTIYLLLCTMKLPILRYIRDSGMFLFPEYSNIPINTGGVSLNFVNEKIIFIFADIFHTLIIIGRKHVHFISNVETQNILRDKQSNPKTKLIRLKIIGRQFLRKNKDN